PEAQDEQILLITLSGGFRGGYSRVEVAGGEILLNNRSGGHCVETGHLIVRLTHPNGYVFTETGRRCSSGLVEIFTWDGSRTMPTVEFEAWRNQNAPDLSDDSREAAMAKVAERRKAYRLIAHQREDAQADKVSAKTAAEAA